MALRAATPLFRKARSLAVVFQRALPESRSYSVKEADVEDDIVKQAFIKQQTQLRAYLQELEKTKIPLDPEDSKAVKEYAESIKKIRTKLGVPSVTEKLNDLLEAAAEDSETVRSFLEKSSSLRQEMGIDDELGAEPLMFDALAAIEKKLGKPLVVGDPKGAQAWQEALDGINAKLGLSEADLEKLEGEVDLDIAKANVAEIRADAEEKISTYKRRDGLDGINVDPQEIDPRAYL